MSEPDQSLVDAAEALPDTFLLCREIGHSWRKAGSPKQADGLVVQKLVCRNKCGTTREDRVTRAGSIFGRRYEYREGYGLHGFGRAVHDRSTFRRVVLARAGFDVGE